MTYDEDDSFTALDTRDGRRVTLRMKRAMRPDATPADTLRAFPNPNTFNAVHARIEAEAMAKADDDGGGGSASDHPVVQLARLLVASGKFSDHAAALDHLLNTSHGAALLHRTRTHKAEKEEPMDTLTAIMKSGGIAGTCAAIVAKGTTTISEHELVEAATKVAADRHPELSPAQAFAKVFTASTEEARVLQKAIAIAKAMPFVADLTPLVVGTPAAMHEAVDDTESSEAYAQLKQLGARKWPTATEAQQFANAFSDPANAALAQKAHRRPPPTTSFPFPR